MLKLCFIEIFMRTVPEVFLMMLGIYVVTKQKFNIKTYILSSFVIGIAIYFIRELPIYFGVHTLISIVLMVSVMVITGVPVIKAIYGTLLTFFSLSVSEFLNLLLLTSLKIDASFGNMDPVKKCLLGYPSLIMLALSILIAYFLLKKREGKKNDVNRKLSS